MKISIAAVLLLSVLPVSGAPATAPPPKYLQDQRVGRVLLQMREVEYDGAPANGSEASLRIFQFYDFDSEDIHCAEERCAASRLLFVFWRRGEVPETAIQVSPGAFDWRDVALKSFHFEQGTVRADIEAERKTADNKWVIESMRFEVKLD
jgi:hypothetical protein